MQPYAIKWLLLHRSKEFNIRKKKVSTNFEAYNYLLQEIRKEEEVEKVASFPEDFFLAFLKCYQYLRALQLSLILQRLRAENAFSS